MKKILFVALFACVASPVLAQDADVRTLVTQVAQQHGINPAILHAIVKKESGYRCHARNGPYQGIMQVHPRTARGVGVTGNLSDCVTGLEAGARYLKVSITKYGTGCGGISAYNTGHYKTGYCTAYGRSVLGLAKSPTLASF